MSVDEVAPIEEDMVALSGYAVDTLVARGVGASCKLLGDAGVDIGAEKAVRVAVDGPDLEKPTRPRTSVSFDALVAVLLLGHETPWPRLIGLRPMGGSYTPCMASAQALQVESRVLTTPFLTSIIGVVSAFKDGAALKLYCVQITLKRSVGI